MNKVKVNWDSMLEDTEYTLRSFKMKEQNKIAKAKGADRDLMENLEARFEEVSRRIKKVKVLGDS